MFIDELNNVITECGIKGIQLNQELLEIFLLMFADDVGLFSDTRVGLQKHLNILYTFCNDWKLMINVSKTKLVVLKKAACYQNFINVLKSQPIECVNGFTYIGVHFPSRLTSFKMAEHNALKAKRVCYCILSS